MKKKIRSLSDREPNYGRIYLNRSSHNNILLTGAVKSWGSFFEMDRSGIPDDFMLER